MKAKQTDYLPFLQTSPTSVYKPKIQEQDAPHINLADIKRTHNNSAALQYLEDILNRGICLSASHIYIEPDDTLLRVRYRTINDIREEITPSEQRGFDIKELLVYLNENNNSQFIYGQTHVLKADFGAARYHLKIMPLYTVWGLSLTIGLSKVPKFAPVLDQLRIPHSTLRQIRELLYIKSGFVLLAGPQTSGKLLTRLAMLQELNTPERKIISLEENPVIKLPRVCHLPLSNASNEDFINYILQQSPDICSTDNIARIDAPDTLLKSTLNGTTLIATTHAPSAIDALEQLINLGCSKHVIAQSLKGILTQQEIPAVCPDCKKVYHLSATERIWIQQNFPGDPIVEGRFTIGEGCDKCACTGLFGSYNIYELICSSGELGEAIIEGSRSSLTTAISLRDDFRSIKQRAFSLLNQGIINIQQIMSIT